MPIELAIPLERAIQSIRPSIARRGHALSVDLPLVPIRLKADPTRLEQIFGNLLNNAVKYTPPGGRIEVSAREEGSEAVLTVRDTGLGLSAEMLSKVFEMFVQDRKHSGHAQGGLGIGLGLSRSLAELHGGRISARSEGPGRGSEFEVRLPLAAGALESAGLTLNGRSNGHSPAPRRRVLVVDDNEGLARSLARLLERIHGQEVRVAHDGLSALKLAEEFQPEMILLDIGMPEMDGCELARRIRLRPEFAETLLIALTGWGQEADRRRSEEAGIDRHLVKPIDPDILGELLASSR
jgi:CheY-like chemotaxis protein